MRGSPIVVLLAAAVMLAAGGVARGYDVGPVNSTDATAVPDVNKNPFPPAGPPNPDYGCWAAAASDVLAAAGWGTGADAATRAANIYADFIAQFKVNAGDTYIQATGAGGAAAKWWVANVGLNSAKAGYTPTATYVNFREVNRTLFESDYNFLLNELKLGPPRQYAMVHWLLPGSGMGHCVTLVGGNYGPNGKAPPNPVPWTSVWHDSDSNPVIGADEPRNTYNFAVGQNNTWFQDNNIVPTPANTADDWIAEGYFLACPGVPKPATAIGNFDIHRYAGLAGPVYNPTTSRHECNPQLQMTTTGSNYGTYKAPDGIGIDPFWLDPSPTNPTPTLVVPNQLDQTKPKKLYVLVDFNDPTLVPKDGLGNPVAPAIIVQDNNGTNIALGSAQWASDNGEVMMTYTFDTQPPWEQIIFPGAEYNNLWAANSNVYEWDIATECVPEPATLALVVLGVAGLVARRRGR